MLRRHFIAGVTAMPIVASRKKSKIAIAEALDVLKAALENDPDISRVEVHFDMAASVPVIVAAYKSTEDDYTPSA